MPLASILAQYPGKTLFMFATFKNETRSIGVMKPQLVKDDGVVVDMPDLVQFRLEVPFLMRASTAASAASAAAGKDAAASAATAASAASAAVAEDAAASAEE